VTERAEVYPTSGYASTPCWFALRVRSQYERVVASALQSIGVEEFVPTYTTEVRYTDRVKRSERPLFPGYVFARFDARLDGFRVIQLTGVVNILGSSNIEPYPIPDEQIETVRKLISTATTMPVHPCEFALGEAVTIASGPLAGVRGVIKTIKGSKRLVVNVEFLQRAVNVEVDEEILERAA
jgi:transcription termination/antitermination protein NusG